MKLAKLSLAAIMTVGALSTANAQPLEEAIKGVDFSGFARYRFHDVEGNNANLINDNDYDLKVKMVAPVTDNLKFTSIFSAGGTNVDYKGDLSKGTAGSSSYNPGLGKMWFTYKQDALTVQAGRQAIGTPITDNGYRGNKGDGILALYNLGSVTLAAAYYNTSNTLLNDSEINAAAAIGSFGPVNAQVWYIRAVDLVDHLIFAQVDVGAEGVTLTGQFINTKLDVPAPAEDTGTFYALKVAYALDNFAINAGYTSNDDDQPIHALALDGDNSVIAAGWRLNYDIPMDGITGGDQYFVDGSVTFGKFGLMAGYAAFDSDVDDYDATEFWGGVSYKYAKNFNTYVKYSDLSSDADAVDQDFLRFEAKYSF